MEFVKMQGIGNDYIMLNDVEETLPAGELPELARRLSNRNFGIGGDGIIIVRPSATADFRMLMFNSDGSEGQMCGNGIRCFAKFVRDERLTASERLVVDTGAGQITTELLSEDGPFAEVRALMGKPRFRRSEIPMLGRDIERVVDERVTAAGKDFFVLALSMGNPHCVVFVESLAEVELANWGQALETHPVFPERTNVEFVEVTGVTRLKMAVWERGSGATLACGTGACASVVAAATKGMIARRATVDMPGGSVTVDWDDDDLVWLTGGCAVVFRGVTSTALISG